MEEISLKQFIEIIIKRKMILITITVISIITSFVVNNFVFEPVYEARMVLMASNFSDRLQAPQQKGDGIDNILSAISQYPNMTMETYKQQVKAPRIMRETIKDLGLEEQYDVETLAKDITLETIKDTNLITIRFRSNNAEQSATIANKIGEKFIKFVSDKAREQATTSSQYLTELLVTENEKLDKALLDLKEFLAEPRGTAELSKELEAKLVLITEYKNKLIDSQLTKEILKEKINEVNTQISKTPKLLVTTKSVGEDNIVFNTIKDETSYPTKEILSVVMTSEEINPVYLELSSLSANLNIEFKEADATISNLYSQINQVQKQIDELQFELAEKSHIETQLQNKVNLTRNYYDAFTKKHEELKITETSQVGESNMVLISRAFPSTKPVAPQKALNVLIATILGVLLSIITIMFVEYWQTSEIKYSVK